MRSRLSLFLAIAMFPSFLLQAQRGIINQGALMVVKNNAVINIRGGSAASYVSQTNGSFQGRMDLNGKIYLEGNWLNSTTGGNGLINPGTDGEVILNGTTQQSVGGTQATYFEKLTLNNAAGATLTGPVNLYGNLGLSSGLLKLNSYPLLLSSGSAITGTPTMSTMVVADGTGELRKNFTGTGSFLFPVGDVTSVAEYSPVTLLFNSGTFGSGAWAGVRVTDAKHTSNTSSSNFISRYWTVSQNNITSFSCTPTFTYLDSDINGTESALYGGLYVTPFWTLLSAANTAANTFSGTVTALGDFTAGQSSAFSVSFTMSDDGMISESAENGEVITVNLFNATFVPSLNIANWSILNQPQGVSIGSVNRINNTQATVTLTGNRTKDYDADITNMALTIGSSELNNLSSGSVTASSGVTFKANNDAESIIMSDDGNITEGSIAGEKIVVTVNGGTFASALNPANWSLTNIPSGISIGSVTKTGINTAEITLAGVAADYDTNYTHATLSVAASEIDEYTGPNLTTNTGVTFIAIDESLVISMANDASGIQEGAENGEVITVTISNKTFNGTLNPSLWTLSNLPQGVSLGSLSRTDATHVNITLSGNRTKDYDSDINNTTLQVGIGEIVGITSVATLNTGVIFTANNDPESLSVSSGTINEGSENGGTISVTLVNGTFASTLTKANWVISNLPTGVTIGSITRNSSTLATITLSGNRLIDYDSDIILSLAVNEAEIDDYTGPNLTPSSGVAKLTANNDTEQLTMSDNGLTEGAENGKIITVNLSGGTIVNPINPANWVLSNMPTGVSKGSVTRISSTQVQITLSGNATVDYDANITNCTLTVNAAEIDDNSTGVSVSNGVTFVAIDEPVTISLSDNSITEGSENGKIITVTLSQDVFVASLTPASWTITNLPTGVSAGSITRTDGTHVNITLSGNRTVDYDNNITNLKVQFAGNQLTAHTSSPISASTGVVFNAINDAESLSMANDNTITEGSESGKTITVTLLGGTFASVLTPANWSISGQPVGVSIGSLQRLSSTQVRITLSGNRTVDYDSDITSMQLSVGDAEVDDYTGANLTVNSGVTFSAILETLAMSISSGTITEGSENGKQITVTLSGGNFAATLDLANWSVSNLPVGVSKGSVVRSSSTQAVITLSGNRTQDYDADITNVTVTCKAPEIVAYAGPDITSATGIVFTAMNEQLSAAAVPLTEINLHNATIALTLTNESFADNTLLKSNFILNNAPAGTSVASVTWTDAAHASLKIAYDSANYDFDTDIPDFSITILPAELTGIASVTSNNLYITAVVETVTGTISSSSALAENNLDGAILNLTLSNEKFTDNSLSAANFQLINAPTGLSIGAVEWISSATARISLSFDGTDFDTDFLGVKLLISGNELVSGSALTSTGIDITALIEIPALHIETGGVLLTEENLNNAVIHVALTNVLFADANLDPSNFILGNAPIGCSVGSVTYLTPGTADLILSFDGTDFDADIQDLSLTINGTELASGSDLSSAETLLIKAIIEPPTVTITALGDFSESNLDGANLSVSLANIEFTGSALPTSLFSLLNAPAGVKIDTVYIQSATQAVLQFAYDQTDFDIDAIISLLVQPDALAGYSGPNLISNELLLPAVIENTSAQISSSGALDENMLNGAVLDLVLVNDTFSVNTVDAAQLTIFGTSVGISVGSVEITDPTHATITLSFHGDFDVDIAGFGISLPGGILKGGRGMATNELPVTAIIEQASALISHPGLTAANLNGAGIQLELVSTSFNTNPLPTSGFDLVNEPQGCSIDTVLFIDNTHAIIQLAFDGTSLPSNIDNFHVMVKGTVLTDGIDLVSNDLTIQSVGIPILSASHPGLTEQNLNGAEIALSLSNTSFADEKLSRSHFRLINAPAGCQVDTVIYLDASHATLVISFDGTDFTSDISDFSIGIDPSELTGLSAELVSNLMSITATTGVDTRDGLSIRIYASDNTIYIACDKPGEMDGYAVVYNMAGQELLTRNLDQKDLNKIIMGNSSHSYLVKVYNRNKWYSAKVTIMGY